MKKILSLLALCGLISFFTGCAALDPGADPVEVRAEQAVQTAFSTLDAFVQLDNVNREFAKEKAPKAHEFAEWLRAPVEVDGAVMPRGLSFIQSANRVRQAYKANRTPENKASLLAAIASLEKSVTEAQQQMSQLKPK